MSITINSCRNRFMEKYLILILLLFLVGCTNKVEVITEDFLGNPIVIEDYDYVGTFANNDEIYVTAYRNNMQDAAWEMILVRNDKVIKLFNSSPTRPKFNSDRTKIIYVDSFQFEMIGNVTIYDSETETETFYTDYAYDSKSETVKDVEWFDEDSILCIVGYAFGTVSQGGMVYQLNLSTKELKLILPSKTLEEWTNRPYEVVDVYLSDSGLDIMLVEWLDENYNDYYYTTHHIFIEETNIEIKK